MIKDAVKKYRPFPALSLPDRTWPDKAPQSPPIWCSVDLRDGNQALVKPMPLEEKLTYFRLLTRVGFKQIEVGFPSSSTTEYDFIRELIEGGHIPDDVAIQVIVQARPQLIERTFEALQGAKRVIFHLYNNISPLQRKVVFDTDLSGVKDMAVQSAQLIRDLGAKAELDGMELTYEYSPEGFSATPVADSVEVCAAVMDAFGTTPDKKVILDLPATVENLQPNQYADAVEYFCRTLPNRDSAIVSVHPHNDRGTAVAATELALLAGAERVEGTLFGNGERTGNVDIVTLALNLLTMGIDPVLELSDLPGIRRVYEETTRMRVGERQPYSGQLVFTAFSGSHQDAIYKGMQYREKLGKELWAVPYLPIDPTDLGRRYDTLVRINSQSGKGGAAFVLENQYGYTLPKAMRPEFGALVQQLSESTGSELSPETVFELFESTYISVNSPYRLTKYSFDDKTDNNGHSSVCFTGKLFYNDIEYDISGSGNGPIDAFFNAVSDLTISRYHFMSYSEHAVSSGSDSKAAAYIQLATPDGGTVFGVGLSHNIYLASIRGIICAINRGVALKSARNHRD